VRCQTHEEEEEEEEEEDEEEEEEDDDEKSVLAAIAYNILVKPKAATCRYVSQVEGALANVTRPHHIIQAVSTVNTCKGDKTRSQAHSLTSWTWKCL
jgi:hypothetical protein